MATYAIGDIQGCFSSFMRLLEAIRFDAARDRLWLVGDLINRGPDSLAVLRWARQHTSALRVVLGNHDLHRVGRGRRIRPAASKRYLAGGAAAPDREELLGWLRTCRMAYREDGYLMVHAGVLPQWSALQTCALAAEVEEVLQGDGYRNFLAHMYGNHPNQWDDGLQGMDRLRLITNALTRLRVCSPDGAMDFHFKGELPKIPDGMLPWFELERRRSADVTLVFGHWSALGLVLRDNLIALDTGCLWGGQLTAICLENRRVIQVPCDVADSVKKQWLA